MCAAVEINSEVIRPGRLLRAWRNGQVPVAHVWAGFARNESLGWWKRKGAELVDVPAHRFAERSDKDGRLRWDAVPPGYVVRGLLDSSESTPLLKVVTRAATAEELERFEHPRMPLIELPLFSAEPLAGEQDAQAELF